MTKKILQDVFQARNIFHQRANCSHQAVHKAVGEDSVWRTNNDNMSMLQRMKSEQHLIHSRDKKEKVKTRQSQEMTSTNNSMAAWVHVIKVDKESSFFSNTYRP